MVGRAAGRMIDGSSNMGPWGYGTFEDELACDWLEDLFDSDPVAFFEQCLDLDGLEYLEYLAGIGVICTCELIHGLCNRPRHGLPQAVLDWVQTHQNLQIERFLPRAIAGMRRVIGPASELRERWEDNEQGYDEWFRHVTGLLRCLEADFRDATNGSPGQLGQQDREESGPHA